MHLLEFGAMR